MADTGPPPPVPEERGKENDQENKEGGKENEQQNKEGEQAEESKEIHHDIATFKPKDELATNYVQLHFSFGMESHRRYNMEYIDDTKIVMASGNTVKILDINTLEHTLLPGVAGTSIGAIAVHPSRQYLAVAEKGTNPAIFIYTYPDLELYRVLQGGTQRSYSYISFSHTGSKLASVGGFPDYMLTLWEWETEKILLRTKAFSQEVYRVTFSPDNEGQLTSSGTGHIKFWKMASTFTGLKLQGDIGKFGKSELSDIVGYVQLPDGKVLSGSESGILLLWDGNIVKCEIWKHNQTPCHDGMVECVFLEGKELLTAGVDGYVRFWDFETLDNADISGEGQFFELDPIREVKIGGDKSGNPPVQIRSMIRSLRGDHWLIQDGMGALWKMDAASYECHPTMLFHAGAIVGIDTCPVDHVAATIGTDGTVRMVDYHNKTALFHIRFSAPGSCLLWAPLSVDEEGRTLVAGFADGVMRVLLRCADAFKVLHVSKPATKKLTSLAYSPDGKILATGSEDATVFFFLVHNDYTPLGFIHVESGVTSLSWSPGGQYLLVCCASGKVFEVTPPNSFLSFDTSVTYEIRLSMKEYIPKPPTAAPAEPTSPTTPRESGNSILTGFYTGNGFDFMLSLENVRGTVLECTMKDPVHIRTTKTHSLEACRSVRMSKSGNFLLFGSDDGSLLVVSSSLRTPHWRASLHGAAVRGFVSSFDDAYLLSVGEDGNFFVSTVSGRTVKEGTLIKLPAAAAETKPLRPILDITSPTNYSIQQGKLRDEQDRLRMLADDRKAQLRMRVQMLRESFADLARANEEVHPSAQLSRVELAIDNGLQERIEASTKKKLEAAKEELAWVCEKKELLLQNFKKRYLDNVATEKVLLKAFNTDHSVSTYPQTHMDPKTKRKIQALHDILEREAQNKDTDRKKLKDSNSDEEDEAASSVSEDKPATPLKKHRKSDIPASAHSEKKRESQVVDKAEEAKRRRLQRAKQWEEYYSARPSEKKEDLDDMEKIRGAQRNMGDYPLKIAKDYRVPEHQRVNAEKKKRQKLLLEESFHEIKTKFNERVLSLRDVKQQIIEAIAKYNKRIREIDSLLGSNESLFDPVLEASEEPGKRLDYDKNDVLEYEKMVAKTKKDANKSSLMVLMGTNSPKSSEIPPEPGFPLPRGGISGAPSANPQLSIQSAPPSELETVSQQIAHSALRFEKDSLLQKIQRIVESFDASLNELRHEKFQLDAELKHADMKMIVLYKELVLLKEFEKQDVALASKLKSKRAEKAEFVTKMNELQEKLANRSGDLEKMAENLGGVTQEFQTLVEGHAQAEALTKIFDKQVKRKAIKASPSSTSLGGDDDDEEDNFDVDDFEDEDEDETEDVCPPGCDKALFASVLALRERRVALDDNRNDIRKGVDSIKKEIESMNKKDKIIEAALKAAENEIQQFQNEKQQKLNELEVVLTLKMHQIQCMVGDRLPDSIQDCLVFASTGLKKLDLRVEELVEEIAELRTQLKTLRKELLNLKKDKETKKTRNKELDEKCAEVQMLKFGQVINLETLEQMSVNKTAEELKERLKLEQTVHLKDIEHLDNQIRQAKARLRAATAGNTERMQKLGDLTAAVHFLEQSLDASKQGVAAEYDGRLKQDLMEEKKLKAIAKMQQQELMNKVNEIQVLRSKVSRVHL